MSHDYNQKSPIDVENISWQEGKAEILKDIGFQLEKGSFTGIIGPNGSGKTTLLRNMSAWYKPRQGTILINGENISSFSSKELAREMAVVTQNPGVDFEFTAHDVVLMGRSPYIPRFGSETEEDMKKTKEVMELTKTWDFRDRLVTDLSAGELQRVAIARALAQDTPILLMDEPISNLDINHQVQIMDLIKDYQKKRGLTVIVVLHDLNMAARYCEGLILLSKGKIFSLGDTNKVLTIDNIREVYGLDVHIIKNPISKHPIIIPASHV